MKHIEVDIWELRPLRDRIFFVGWQDNRFVLLHSFMKKTQKTPPQEIELAKREYAELLERGNVKLATRLYTKRLGMKQSAKNAVCRPKS